MHRGNILRDAIKRSNYTQTDVAEALGYNQPNLSRLLKDENLRDDIIEKACAFLGIDKDSHFSADALAEPEQVYHNKYDALLTKYLEEKERWLNEKEEYVNELAKLREELAKALYSKKVG